MSDLDKMLGGDELLESAMDQEGTDADLAHEIAMATNSLEDYDAIIAKISELGFSEAQRLWISGEGFEIDVAA